MNLKELVDHAMETAKQISTEGAQVNAALLLVDEDGKVVILGFPHYAEHREFSVATMKAALEHHHAERYAFVFEAWVSVRKAADTPDLAGIIPSRDPDRIEAICVIAKERNGQQATRFAQIKRHGHKVMFKEEGSNSTPMFGVLDNLFGEKGKPQ